MFTLTLLLLIDVIFVLDEWVMVLVDPGPVKEMLLLPPLDIGTHQLPNAPPLLILTQVRAPLLFEALPECALPPIVFPLTLADPLVADWLLLFDTPTLLALNQKPLLLDDVVMVLLEPGPVVLILDCADAIPTRPNVAVAIPIAL